LSWDCAHQRRSLAKRDLNQLQRLALCFGQLCDGNHAAEASRHASKVGRQLICRLGLLPRLPEEEADWPAGPPSDQGEDALRRSGAALLDKMQECPRDVGARHLSQAQAGCLSSLPNPKRIDGYA
jgi:hypothetical protein